MIAQILVVDDDPTLRLVLRDFLESRHHRVLEATDGAQGFVIAEEKMPHLIIMDIMMPGVYGTTAAKRLQDHWRTSKIPIIILTAVEERRLAALIAERPDVRFLRKPVNLDLLDQTIKELLPRGGFVP